MKTNYNTKSLSKTWASNSHFLRSILLLTIALGGLSSSLNAQAPYTRPSWFFGMAGAANLNFYRGTTQVLNTDLTVPKAFHNAFGTDLYLAPVIEFHKPEKRFGLILQGGYDGRSAKYDQVTNPCNCPADLTTKLTYLTLEPSLRFAPFKGNLYLYAGPRFAFSRDKTFTYKIGLNPEYPSQTPVADVKGDLSDVKTNLISGQIGAGYDIYLSSTNRRGQFVLSPFVAFHPYFGQDPRSIESLNITTVRAGIVLKVGRGKSTTEKVVEKTKDPIEVVEASPETKFTVVAPHNIPVVHRTRETFPLRNYVFFNLGSTNIPERYVLLTKNQVADFKEDQLEVFTPKNLNGRSARQMTVYYNVLNILGDRMGKNPNATIVLVGSSEKGVEDGSEMAQTVKNYLINVFGISATRISIEGRYKPKLPSEQPGGALELDLLREGDRRVSIESSSPALLLEFQSGPDAPLKGVEIIQTQETIDSSLSFTVEGASSKFTSWSIELKDENDVIQKFGPYTQDKVYISSNTILGSKKEGDYTIIMSATTKSGKVVKKATSAHIVSYTPPRIEEGMRYSVLFEFNDSKSTALYEKYITDVVTPKIPAGGTVIIHGHTDIIGDDVYNQSLAQARANDVKRIILAALAKSDRTDVKFEVLGYGEDVNQAPFENQYPEERFYNRTVIIDIIPVK